MAVLLVTLYAGVGVSADRSKSLSDRFRSLPLWRPAPIVGALLGDIARYLLARAWSSYSGSPLDFAWPGRLLG